VLETLAAVVVRLATMLPSSSPASTPSKAGPAKRTRDEAAAQAPERHDCELTALKRPRPADLRGGDREAALKPGRPPRRGSRSPCAPGDTLCARENVASATGHSQRSMRRELCAVLPPVVDGPGGLAGRLGDEPTPHTLRKCSSTCRNADSAVRDAATAVGDADGSTRKRLRASGGVCAAAKMAEGGKGKPEVSPKKLAAAGEAGVPVAENWTREEQAERRAWLNEDLRKDASRKGGKVAHFLVGRVDAWEQATDTFAVKYDDNTEEWMDYEGMKRGVLECNRKHAHTVESSQNDVRYPSVPVNGGNPRALTYPPISIVSDQAPQSSKSVDDRECGVGMTLEPDPGSNCQYFHVGSMKAGGALAKDGQVKSGDKLVRVDGFHCRGVRRANIKERVKGPAKSEIVLEFERAGRVFKVTLLRTSGFAATHRALATLDQNGVEHRKDRAKDPALGDGKTAAQAQLLSSNVRNSISESATSQAENGDREQCLERSARSPSECFRGSLSDKERGNGRDRNRDADRAQDAEGRGRDRQETGWGQARDTERQRGRAISPLRGQSAKDEERDRERNRERERERERERSRNRDSGEVRGGDAGGYWRDDKGRKDAGGDAHGRHRDCYGDSQGTEKSQDLKRNIDINKQIMRAQGVSELCTLIETRVAEFNHVNVSTAFRTLLQAPRDGGPRGVVERALQALEAAALRTIDAFGAQHVSNTLHIMA